MSADEQPFRSLPIPGGVDALSVAFSPDGKLLCCGCNDGQVRTYYADRNFKPVTATLNSTMTEGKDMKTPVIGAEFRPETFSSPLTNVLATGCVDGNVVLWHMGQTRRLASVRLDHELLSLGFSPSGDVLAVAGLGSAVTMLDAPRLTSAGRLTAGEGPDGTLIDCGRLQSLKFIDENTLVTCGWGHTMRIWDRRVAHGCVASIFGPYVCGDGLDVAGHICAVASYREENPLELYDLRTCNKIRDVKWSSRSAEQDDIPVMLFCCKFGPGGHMLAAGGNEGHLEVFDLSSADRPRSGEWRGLGLGKATVGRHTVNSLRWSGDGGYIAAACSSMCLVMQTGAKSSATAEEKL
jgi:WD40 repeat protein